MMWIIASKKITVIDEIKIKKFSKTNIKVVITTYI